VRSFPHTAELATARWGDEDDAQGREPWSSDWFRAHCGCSLLSGASNCRGQGRRCRRNRGCALERGHSPDATLDCPTGVREISVSVEWVEPPIDSEAASVSSPSEALGRMAEVNKFDFAIDELAVVERASTPNYESWEMRKEGKVALWLHLHLNAARPAACGTAGATRRVRIPLQAGSVWTWIQQPKVLKAQPGRGPLDEACKDWFHCSAGDSGHRSARGFACFQFILHSRRQRRMERQPPGCSLALLQFFLTGNYRTRGTAAAAEWNGLSGTMSFNKDPDAGAPLELGHAAGFKLHLPSGDDACANTPSNTMCVGNISLPIGSAFGRSLESHDIHTWQAKY